MDCNFHQGGLEKFLPESYPTANDFDVANEVVDKRKQRKIETWAGGEKRMNNWIEIKDGLMGF